MTSSNKILLVFLLFFCIQDVASENGLDVSALSGKSKKFFFDVSEFGKMVQLHCNV